MSQTSPLASLQQQEAAVASAIRQTAVAVRSMGSPVEAALIDLADAVRTRRDLMTDHMARFIGELAGLTSDFAVTAGLIMEPIQLLIPFSEPKIVTTGPDDDSPIIDLAEKLPAPVDETEPTVATAANSPRRSRKSK